jgi:hypothetical protein
VLGGRTPVTEVGLQRIRDRLHEESLLLLCKEEAPASCHRHQYIAVGLLPEIEAFHIFRDEVSRPLSSSGRSARTMAMSGIP